MKALVCLFFVVALAPVLGAGDPATPKDVAAVFAKAMDAGDFAAAKPFMLQDAPYLRLIESMAANTVQRKRLTEIAVAKFGKTASDIGGSYSDPGLEKVVGRANVEIKGDVAEIREKPGEIFLKLQKREGEWRVDVKGSSEADVLDQIPLLDRESQCAAVVADGIAGGKYATLAEAKRALQELRKVRPQTQPSTKPTAQRPGG